MKAVVTRVSSASVEIGGEMTARIGTGFLVLLGVTHSDGERDADRLAAKICSLRVFEDGAGKMNLSLGDAGGELLVVSNFTLYANCAHGRRPDFLAAARPDAAIPLYERFVDACRREGFSVSTGQFGADMMITSANDGPVTLVIDSKDL